MYNIFMKFNVLKNYVSAFILSILGYLNILFLVFYFTIIKPELTKNSQEIIAKFGEDLASGLFEGLSFSIYLYVLLTVLGLFIIERIIKIFKNYSLINLLNNRYLNIIFYLGIIFSILPLLFTIIVVILFFIYIHL